MPLFAVMLVAALFAPVSLSAKSKTAPVLSLQGHTLKWTALPSRRVFVVHAKGHKLTKAAKAVNVSATSYTPAAFPGQTVLYKVRSTIEGGWSNQVSITYPPLEGETVEPPPSEKTPKEKPPKEEKHSEPPPVEEEAPKSKEEAPTSGMIVGLDAGGWGASAFGDVAGAVRSVRMESRFATEAEVGGAAAAGVSVGSWVFGTGGKISSIEPAALAAEIVSVFKHYGRGGSFWKGRTDLGGQAVEVLNEPSVSSFWSDAGDYTAYEKLLKVVHEALVANFAEAIRPKLLASWDGGAGPSSKFGTQWASLGGLAYVDGVTVHPYGGANGQNGGALGSRADVEDAYLLSGKPVYITEIGWPTAVGQPATGDSQQWSETQQAQNITNFVNWARGLQYVGMVDIFNYIDYGTNYWYGIERTSGAHKLSYAALAQVSR
jgi:hypothetical protein